MLVRQGMDVTTCPCTTKSNSPNHCLSFLFSCTFCTSNIFFVRRFFSLRGLLSPPPPHILTHVTLLISHNSLLAPDPLAFYILYIYFFLFYLSCYLSLPPFYSIFSVLSFYPIPSLPPH